MHNYRIIKRDHSFGSAWCNFLFISLFCLVSHIPVNAQSVTYKNYTTPREFELFENPGDSSYLSYEIDGRFYPIGWSADGKFAYIKVSEASTCDCYGVEIIVYNVSLDQSNRIWGYDQEEDSLHLNNLDKIWRHFYSSFIRKLDSFNIKQVAVFAPIETNQFFDKKKYLPLTWGLDHDRALSFIQNNTNFNISIADYRAKPDSSVPYIDEVVSSYSFRIEERGKLPGTIYHSTSKDNDSGLLRVGLLHAFADPTGRWIVFITGKSFAGWEGPPARYDFDLAGFKL